VEFYYTLFLFGVFGVENQRYGIRENFDHAASDFCGVGPNRKYIEQNQKHLTNWNHKLEKLCFLNSVFPNLQKYAVYIPT